LRSKKSSPSSAQALLKGNVHEFKCFRDPKGAPPCSSVLSEI